MITIEMSKPGAVIGRIGENEAARIAFNIGGWLRDYPDGQISVLCKRPLDPGAYPVPSEQIAIDGGTLYWTLSSADLAQTGSGQCELILTDDGVKAKSEIFGILIRDALDGSAEPPEPWQGWIDDLTDLMDEKIADAAAEVTNAHAEAVAAAESADNAAGSAQEASESARQAAIIVATYGLQATQITGNKYKMAYGREEE